MNIAHFIHGLGLGGAQKVIASLVRVSASMDLRFFVYSSNDGVLRPDVEAAGAVVRIVQRHVPKFDPFWLARLSSWLRKDQIHLVHAHLFGDSLHGYLAARFAGRPPVVVTLHSGTEACSPLQLLGYRWLLPRCDRIVACSSAVSDSFHQLSARVQGIETIPNGIQDPGEPAAGPQVRRDARGRLGLDPHIFVVAGIGRLVKEKGYRHLIAAFAQLIQRMGQDFRLVLLGDGPARRQLEREASRLGVRDELVFAGYRPDIAEILPAIDLIVISSLREGLPIVLLEAMAAQRCIVTTDVPGILEAVRDGLEALVVPRGDTASLSRALMAAAADADLRSHLARAARHRFLKNFTDYAMAQRYLTLYEKVTAEQEN